MATRRCDAVGNDAPSRLLDLPDELLLVVACALRDGRDLEALGGACHHTRRIARDDRAWQCLFERQFGEIYARAVPAMAWKRHPDEPWPVEAASFWRQILDVYEPAYESTEGALWPQCPFDRSVPAPFAHMRALGKDWRWLYVVHAMPPRALAGTTSMRSGPATMVLNRETCVLKTVSDHIQYRGDVDHAGQAHGYGVEIYAGSQQGDIEAWVECAWNKGVTVGWFIFVNDTRMSYGPTPATNAERNVKFTVSRNTGWRAWGSTKKGHMHGICMWQDGDEHNTGSFYMGAMRWGNPVSATRHLPDGCTNGHRYNADGRRHGDALVRYPNGDSVSFVYEGGSVDRVISFRCSPSCSDPAFAGRVIGDVGGWHLQRLSDVESHWNDHAYWPRDMTTPDARLFARYVAAGFAGWDRRVHAAVLDALREPPGAAAKDARQ